MVKLTYGGNAETRKCMTYGDVTELQSKLALFAGNDGQSKDLYNEFKQVFKLNTNIL